MRGDLKVDPLGPAELLAPGHLVDLKGVARTIERSKLHDKIFHLKLAGIDNREDAAELRGLYLEVPERDLPSPGEDSYYRYQLIGLTVITSEGEEVGTIGDIISTPGNDVFVVQGPAREVLIPGVDDIVLEVDLHRGRMIIEAVPGLLD